MSSRGRDFPILLAAAHQEFPYRSRRAVTWSVLESMKSHDRVKIVRVDIWSFVLRSSFVIEESYRLVVETASDAIVSMDETGAIRFANPATMRIFGYDRTELIGKPLTVLMPEVMRKMHETGFRRYLAAGQRHLN